MPATSKYKDVLSYIVIGDQSAYSAGEKAATAFIDQQIKAVGKKGFCLLADRFDEQHTRQVDSLAMKFKDSIK